MPTQSFFLEGRYLGSREVPAFVKVPGFDIRPQRSQAIFCMHCGDIWARLVIEGPGVTYCEIRPCLKHGDGRIACPPTWLDYPSRFADDWPDDAVRHEFLATLNFYERLFTSCNAASSSPSLLPA